MTPGPSPTEGAIQLKKADKKKSAPEPEAPKAPVPVEEEYRPLSERVDWCWGEEFRPNTLREVEKHREKINNLGDNFELARQKGGEEFLAFARDVAFIAAGEMQLTNEAGGTILQTAAQSLLIDPIYDTPEFRAYLTRNSAGQRERLTPLLTAKKAASARFGQAADYITEYNDAHKWDTSPEVVAARDENMRQYHLAQFKKEIETVKILGNETFLEEAVDIMAAVNLNTIMIHNRDLYQNDAYVGRKEFEFDDPEFAKGTIHDLVHQNALGYIYPELPKYILKAEHKGDQDFAVPEGVKEAAQRNQAYWDSKAKRLTTPLEEQQRAALPKTLMNYGTALSIPGTPVAKAPEPAPAPPAKKRRGRRK